MLKYMLQPAFDTVTQAITWLQQQGYIHDFNLDADCIKYNQTTKLMPQEFRIDFVFRFEGETDPGDENVVYGIAAVNDDVKGILMNGYGIYSDSLSDDMIRKFAYPNKSKKYF